MSSQSSNFLSGGSPSAIQVNGWAQGTIGYAQVTANQTGITAGVDLTNLTVTVTVVAGRRIRVSGKGEFQNNTANTGSIMFINEGATQLQAVIQIGPVANQGMTLFGEAILTPSAGSHTYKLRAQTAGGGTTQLTASVTDPAYILIEDIGSV